MRWAAALVLVAGPWTAACAGNAGDVASSDAGVRFAIEVVEAPHPPVWVQMTTESRPVGWIRVLGPDGPVDLEPRCEVPDCGEDAVVCGAALPTVRRIAAADGAGAVEYRWDGTMSEMVADGQCERRVRAPEGEYTATLCWSENGPANPGGDPTEPAMGRLSGTTCVERVFTLGRDAEVVVHPDSGW